jgi:hypothetical protein
MAPTDSSDRESVASDHSRETSADTDAGTDSASVESGRTGDAPTVETLAGQVERLESEIADLRETVKAQDRTIQFLAGNADLDPLEASCPDCGHTPLRRESGMTWKQLICDGCGQKWYL